MEACIERAQAEARSASRTRMRVHVSEAVSVEGETTCLSHTFFQRLRFIISFVLTTPYSTSHIFSESTAS